MLSSRIRNRAFYQEFRNTAKKLEEARDNGLTYYCCTDGRTSTLQAVEWGLSGVTSQMDPPGRPRMAKGCIALLQSALSETFTFSGFVGFAALAEVR